MQSKRSATASSSRSSARASAPTIVRCSTRSAAQLTAVLERGRLAREAATATALGQANELRGGLLQAVSHDLRTPLASIKAAVSSLRQPDVEWSDEDVAEFLSIDRGRGRSAERARRQPARHEPAPGRRHRTALAARRTWRRSYPPRCSSLGERAANRRDGRVGIAPRRDCRRGAARTRHRQPRRERAQVVTRRCPGTGGGRCGPGRDPRADRRPRARYPGIRTASGLPAVPAPRRPRPRHRRRPRTRGRERLRHRDGRRARARGHARRRHDRDRHAEGGTS